MLDFRKSKFHKIQNNVKILNMQKLTKTCKTNNKKINTHTHKKKRTMDLIPDSDRSEIVAPVRELVDF